MGGRSRSQQKDKQPRKVISVSIQQDVKLHTVENAWKPGAKQEKDAADDPNAIVTMVGNPFSLHFSKNFHTSEQQEEEINKGHAKGIQL